jgi:hypothetical protein
VTGSVRPCLRCDGESSAAVDVGSLRFQLDAALRRGAGELVRLSRTGGKTPAAPCPRRHLRPPRAHIPFAALATRTYCLSPVFSHDEEREGDDSSTPRSTSVPDRGHRHLPKHRRHGRGLASDRMMMSSVA